MQVYAVIREGGMVGTTYRSNEIAVSCHWQQKEKRAAVVYYLIFLSLAIWSIEGRNDVFKQVFASLPMSPTRLSRRPPGIL